MATGIVPDPPYTKVPPLPVQLGPGQMLSVALQVTPPTAPGMYTFAFAFALSYDNLTAAPISTMQPTLYDSAAVALLCSGTARTVQRLRWLLKSQPVIRRTAISVRHYSAYRRLNIHECSRAL